MVLERNCAHHRRSADVQTGQKVVPEDLQRWGVAFTMRYLRSYNTRQQADATALLDNVLPSGVTGAEVEERQPGVMTGNPGYNMPA